MSIAEIESTELALESPTGGLWREAWFRLRRNPSAIVGAIFVLTFVVVAIFAPLIAPYPPEADSHDLPETCCPGPSAAHWFGTNVVGQDTFSRIVYGARLSLIVGIVSVIGRALGRDAAGCDRRLRRGLRRLGDHAPDGHAAGDSGPAARDRDRRAPAPDSRASTRSWSRSGSRTSRSSRGCYAGLSSPSGTTTSCSRRGRSACSGRRSCSGTSFRTRSGR